MLFSGALALAEGLGVPVLLGYLPVPAAAAMLDAVVAREDVEDGTTLDAGLAALVASW
jgi:hypothetical protein